MATATVKLLDLIQRHGVEEVTASIIAVLHNSGPMTDKSVRTLANAATLEAEARELTNE